MTRIETLAMQLRKLSADYYQQLLSLQEYRQQRKLILDEVDLKINLAVKNVSEKDLV